MSCPEFLYRYKELLVMGIPDRPGVTIFEETFMVKRETRCFYVINRMGLSPDMDKEKYVSKTARARFAYPSKQEAMQSFVMRKHWQIKHLERQMEMAKKALVLAQEEYEEIINQEELSQAASN